MRPGWSRSDIALSTDSTHEGDYRVMDRIISERTGLGTTGETYLVDQLNLFVTGERFGRDEFPRASHKQQDPET